MRRSAAQLGIAHDETSASPAIFACMVRLARFRMAGMSSLRSGAVNKLNVWHEVVASGPTLFGWEHIVLRLAVGEVRRPQVEHHAGPLIEQYPSSERTQPN
jgi:hypothetical protein